MSRRWLWGGVALGAVLILGLLGSVLVVGLFLSKPVRTVVGSPPAVIAGAEPVQIASASGSVLQGWWLPGRDGGGAAVLMHGVRGNRLGLVRRAGLLRDAGFAVLLFDFQAHGESAGQRITFGKLEGMDAAAAVAFVRGRAPGERIGAVGISLGGAAALLGPRPLDVDALVLESVYGTIDSALANRLQAGLGRGRRRGAVPVLAPLFKVLLPPILGVAPAELRPMDRIAAACGPGAGGSGNGDVATPLAEARRCSHTRRTALASGSGRWPGQGMWTWKGMIPWATGRLCRVPATNLATCPVTKGRAVPCRAARGADKAVMQDRA